LPTYEYACTACGHRLEAVQKFTDDPLTECPECGAELRKVYGAVGIVLKGSGFYKTDSRAASGGNGSAKKNADAQNGDGSGGDSSSKKESSASETGGSEKASSDKAGSGPNSSGASSSGKDTAPASSTAS
jgi:putative FmdB family regulatory protein